MKLFQKKMTTIAKVDLINECILRSLLTACVLESENFAQGYLVWKKKKKKKNKNNKKNFKVRKSPTESRLKFWFLAKADRGQRILVQSSRGF